MRKKNIILLVLFDIISVNLAYILAFYLKFGIEFDIVSIYIFRGHLAIITAIKCFVFFLFKLYRSLWEYASIDEMLEVVTASIVANLAIALYVSFTKISLPLSIYLIVTLLDILFIGGSRFFYRILRRLKCDFNGKGEERKNVLIIGAGAAGSVVIKELRNHDNLHSKPVALIDDDPGKRRYNINGIPVVGNRNDIENICEEYDIDEIVIAIPSASGKDIKGIMDQCKKTKCKTKILPGVYELIDEKVTINKIREVQIEDLLGREEVYLELDSISNYIKGKRVLITGGGGSIGSELCRQIAKFNPKELIILDIYENGAYVLEHELLSKYKDLSFKVIIGSVRDKNRLEEIFGTNNIDIVFHAAAHKHVPLMEENPTEAVKNNVFGTLNIVEAADKYGVEKFVLISTDKAVNPTNVMGATKRVAEIIIQIANTHSNTDYVAVRFGNVLGSNGSVIPLFKNQIKNGGPVTVTHPDVIRYFMTIPEACQLVLQAGAMAKGGEIFILDMGDPVNIMDLAEDLIRLSGLKPEVDIPIVITGLRPGEKLYEELLVNKEHVDITDHNKIYVEKPMIHDYDKIEDGFKKLLNVIDIGDDYMIKKTLREIVPEYEPCKCFGKSMDKPHSETDKLSKENMYSNRDSLSEAAISTINSN